MNQTNHSHSIDVQALARNVNRSNVEPRSMRKALPILLAGGLILSACSPTIKIEPSDKPIKIDLNVKIDQEIRVKLDKDVEELIADNPDLF